MYAVMSVVYKCKDGIVIVWCINVRMVTVSYVATISLYSSSSSPDFRKPQSLFTQPCFTRTMYMYRVI